MLTVQQLSQLVVVEKYKDWISIAIKLEDVIEYLETRLQEDGYVIVSINNGYHQGGERTLHHDFILCRNKGTDIRIERYPPFYELCVSGDKKWKHDIAKLLEITGGAKRLFIWNHMFDVTEKYDTIAPLRVYIYIRDFTENTENEENVESIDFTEITESPRTLKHRRTASERLGMHRITSFIRGNTL